MRKFLVCFVIVLGLSSLWGCGSARRSEPVVGSVPAVSNQSATGKQVFMRYCHQCHPGGEGGLGPSLNDKPAPGFLIKFQVRRGLGAMPGFPPERIGDPELDSLVAYLKTLRYHRGRDRG